MTHEQLLVKMALNAWDAHVKRIDQLFRDLSDEQLMAEIAPGKNRGIYLLGHLTASHDAMNDILGLGPRKHSNLDAVFLTAADKSVAELPSITELRLYWSDVNANLAHHFSQLPESEWFKRHMKMLDEDFVKEPHRNKLSVLLSRTSHIAYHLGQLILLKR